jgi:hypothetical protein
MKSSQSLCDVTNIQGAFSETRKGFSGVIRGTVLRLDEKGDRGDTLELRRC